MDEVLNCLAGKLVERMLDMPDVAAFLDERAEKMIGRKHDPANDNDEPYYMARRLFATMLLTAALQDNLKRG